MTAQRTATALRQRDFILPPWAVLLVAWLILTVVYAAVLLPEPSLTLQRHSEILDGTIPGPWQYRLIAPFIIKLLPFNALASYVVANSVFGALGLILLYHYLQQYSRRALLGILFVGCILPIMYLTWWGINLWSIIEFSLFLIALLIAPERRPGTYIIYAVLVIIAVLNRSTGIFLIPLWYLARAEKPLDLLS